MANSELFIMGDPRFLSGGARRREPLTCDSPTPKLRPGESTLTTKTLIDLAGGVQGVRQGFRTDRDLVRFLVEHYGGQSVHKGRDSYHRHEYHPDSCEAGNGFNVFCRPEDLPTAGIELETYCRSVDSIEEMKRDLVSNWWHFEEDGSLDRTVGHELITEVLPPRVYRDIATWLGLQNAVSPWLESWKEGTTGLHVHVGLSQFDRCDKLPCDLASDRRRIADFAIAFAYTHLTGYPLGDRVYLRKAGTFCGAADDKRLVGAAMEAKKGRLTAAALFDYIYAGVLTGRRELNQLMEIVNYGGPTGVDRAAKLQTTKCNSSDWGNYSGHHVEVNMQHSETIEFRRGKGTTNAVSIHRMVEFCTLLVRYVWKAAREPDLVLSPESAYGYIIENTSSEALRKTAEEVWASVKDN